MFTCAKRREAMWRQRLAKARLPPTMTNILTHIRPFRVLPLSSVSFQDGSWSWRFVIEFVLTGPRCKCFYNWHSFTQASGWSVLPKDKTTCGQPEAGLEPVTFLQCPTKVSTPPLFQPYLIEYMTFGECKSTILDFFKLFFIYIIFSTLISRQPLMFLLMITKVQPRTHTILVWIGLTGHPQESSKPTPAEAGWGWMRGYFLL